MKLKGKVTLVTDEKTGIGQATSLCLARKKTNVAVNFSQSDAEATQTAANVQTYDISSSTVQADVSNDTQVRTMVLQVQKEYEQIDILVNNTKMTRFIPH